MNDKTKPKFNVCTDLPLSDNDQLSTADLGIEFVHFDVDDNPESEEYYMTRSLVAAQAAK